MTPFLLLASAITIHTDFEGGSLGRVEPVSSTHFRCHLAGQTDQDGRNRQATWYFFRVDGAAGKAITLDLVSLPGEYNYRANRGAVNGNTRPFHRDEGGAWGQFEEVDYDAAEPRLRLRATPKSDRFFIAHVEPYTLRDYEKLVEDTGKHPDLRREVIGKSVEGRALPLLTITAKDVPDSGKKVMWLMARQHAWESGTSFVAEGAIRFLLSDDAGARRIRERVITKILPYADPDGMVHGGVRFNRNGYDLNRNWDVEHARLMPEIHAQRRAILGWKEGGNRLDLFLSLHNTETAEYLEGVPDSSQEGAWLLRRFQETLEQKTSFAPTRSPRAAEQSTSPGKPGRMTVIQGLWRDARLPAFLMEQMVAYNKKLGRVPRSEDRLKFGAELARAMFSVMEDRR